MYDACAFFFFFFLFVRNLECLKNWRRDISLKFVSHSLRAQKSLVHFQICKSVYTGYASLHRGISSGKFTNEICYLCCNDIISRINTSTGTRVILCNDL